MRIKGERTMNKMLLMLPVLLLSGCACWNWIASDNPDAPSVNPSHNGKPPNWPVFKVPTNDVPLYMPTFEEAASVNKNIDTNANSKNVYFKK